MEKKYYPLFSVDVCTMTYAMDYRIVGAESPEDLLAHWEELFGNDTLIDYEHDTPVEIKSLDRITPISDAYTTTPYKVIDGYSYYE